VRDVRSDSAAGDHRIIELERAATIAKAARPVAETPAAPAPSKPKPAPKEPATASKPADAPEPRPFFGGLPDDPGVRNPSAEPEPKTRLRLF